MVDALYASNNTNLPPQPQGGYPWDPSKNAFQTGPNSWWNLGSGQGWNTPSNNFTDFGFGNPGNPMFLPGEDPSKYLTPEQMQAFSGAKGLAPFSVQGPSFQDVLNPLYGSINAPDVSGVGNDIFGQGINTLGLGGGMSPELKNALDIIDQLKSKATGNAASVASALASRRGLAGSSIEQYGVGNAINESSQPFVQQQGNVLLSEAARQQQLRDLQAQALFGRANQTQSLAANLAGQFGGYDLQRRLGMSQLTSDELASLRNFKQAGNNNALQLELGNQSINQANWLASIMQSNQPKGGFFNSVAPGLFSGIGSGIGQGVAYNMTK